MTSAASLVYYPQYCFHLSPTINKWCPLRAIDIAGLESRPGFEDIDVLFHLNHPLRWVRITGVVVAIDDYYGRRVYTVDDSSGQCIECSLSISNPSTKETERDASLKKHTNITHVSGSTNTVPPAPPPAPPPPDIDVGMVVDVKGSVKIFRGQRQINVQKVTRVLSTNQEVLFWDKIRDFRRDVLAQPWVLTAREVRKCLKLQQVEASDLEKRKRKKHAREELEGSGRDGGSSNGRKHVSEGRHRTNDSLVNTSVQVEKAQRAAVKESLRARVDHGKKYDALGL